MAKIIIVGTVQLVKSTFKFSVGMYSDERHFLNVEPM